MSLKILHTADVHLGMKFARYPEIQAELTEARFKTLEKLVAIASRERCQLLTVGGDLFDRVGVLKRDVTRAAEILSRMDGGLVVVLPGNHDYLESREDSLWAQFQEASGDRVVVLKERKAYDLSEHGVEGVCLYAAPCTDKHSSANAVGWVKSHCRDPKLKHHIGLAHGSMDGLTFDREGQYYPMTKKELLELELDFWLMGHVHVQYPPTQGSEGQAFQDAQARIFYPGTPEPDGYDCRHEGKAWLLEVGEDKSLSCKSLSTGSYRYEQTELELQSLADLVAFRKKHESEENKRLLMKLTLRGRLGREEYESLSQELTSLESQLFHMKSYKSSVGVRITQSDIDREFTKDSFPYRLLQDLAASEGDSEALQIAYDLIREKSE